MTPIDEYMLLSKEKRQLHLKLNESCIERGGPEKGYASTSYKGLLAHILDTTYPTGKKVLMCHACNNPKCSNPYHLYWGTPSENSADYIKAGGSNIWQRLVDKYGEDGARQHLAKVRDPVKAGSGNKGKTKSQEHKDKISATLSGKKRGPYNKRD